MKKPKGDVISATGRVTWCPGSGILHPQKLLDVMDGSKWFFARCDRPGCEARVEFIGSDWHEERFMTRAEALEKFGRSGVEYVQRNYIRRFGPAKKHPEPPPSSPLPPPFDPRTR